jgi:hypothetical protein
MRNYRWKKIYLNIQKTNWCIVRIYPTKKEMQQAYYDYCKSYNADQESAFTVSAVSIHFVRYLIQGGADKLSGETGMIFFYKDSCGAGTVSHEFMHSVFHGNQVMQGKEHHPIIINNMAEEEEILYNHTLAVRQFYKWYWKIVKKIK